MRRNLSPRLRGPPRRQRNRGPGIFNALGVEIPVTKNLDTCLQRVKRAESCWGCVTISNTLGRACEASVSGAACAGNGPFTGRTASQDKEEATGVTCQTGGELPPAANAARPPGRQRLCPLSAWLP